MGLQICMILFVFGWTVTVFTPFCYVLKWLNWLRIDPLEEEVGMDLSRHKGSAYQSEGSNAEAVAELSASRRNLVDLSGSCSNAPRPLARSCVGRTSKLPCPSNGLIQPLTGLRLPFIVEAFTFSCVPTSSTQTLEIVNMSPLLSMATWFDPFG